KPEVAIRAGSHGKGLAVRRWDRELGNAGGEQTPLLQRFQLGVSRARPRGGALFARSPSKMLEPGTHDEPFAVMGCPKRPATRWVCFDGSPGRFAIPSRIILPARKPSAGRCQAGEGVAWRHDLTGRPF